MYVPAMQLVGPDGDYDRDLGRPIVEHAEWKPFLGWQWQAFSWEPQGPLARINGLGGWGAGKTHGIGRVAVKASLRNPWRPCYGDSNPTGIIVAPTFRILKQSTMAQFDQLVPRALIKKRRGPPHNDILMANGFRWVLYSGEAEIEGLNACVFWVDEIQHPVFSGDGRRFLNLMARIRDPYAATMYQLTSGLPESGWVRDKFGSQSEDMLTLLAPTRGNPYIPQSTMNAFFDACPSGQEESLLGGQWMSPQGAIYPQYNASRHVTNREGNLDEITHLSLDIGNFGAVLFGQETVVPTRDVVGGQGVDKGLHIVDQILTVDESVDRMCYRIKTETSWNIVPGRSVICVDPTIRRDETKALREHFPGCRIIKRDRGHAMFPVEAGIRQVQRGLMDALGNVRLTFAPKLRNQKLGVLDFLERYRRNEKTNEPIKDNLRDHVGDALRYMVAEVIPTDKPVARIL